MSDLTDETLRAMWISKGGSYFKALEEEGFYAHMEETNFLLFLRSILEGNPLSLVPTQDLVREISRRSSACAIAYLHFDEGCISEPRSTSIVDGNFVHIDGLVKLLERRADMKAKDELENNSETWE